MTEHTNHLNTLIRKLDSDHYDSKIHGEGFIVTRNRKTGDIVQNRNMISDLLNKQHYEYFFVTSHTAPTVIRKMPFEWYEGTSDVALDFDATFKLRVTDLSEAIQLVKALSQSGSPERGLLNMINKHLYQCMARLYSRCQTQTNSNLLDEFYKQELQKGESLELNQLVTEQMQSELKGTDFAIGFTLRNAPERYTDFKHQSKIKETGLEVVSECQLTLCNYQAFKKSGIQDISGVIRHMQDGIDRAIRQHILGKSEMELLSNFKSRSTPERPIPPEQDLSISALLRNSVNQQALAVGYDLKSFHSLPNIAPLQLLTGLMLTFDEDDGAFKTGLFGGRIRLNMRMEVKAIEGEFDKYRHLFSGSDSDNQIDLLNVTQAQILTRIKVHLAAISKEVLRQHQNDHLKAVTRFEEEIRPVLEQAIVEIMCKQHGLDVKIKTLMPIESEDASRLEQLRRKKRPFELTIVSTDANANGAEMRFSSAFEVTTLDLDSPESWDAFESHDYGYRLDSPERVYLPQPADNSDKGWKALAIERELADIELELIRLLKSSDLLIPDLNLWLHDRNRNKLMQETLLKDIRHKIQKSRGLVLAIERLEIQDDTLNSAMIEQRNQMLKQQSQVRDKQAGQQLAALDRNESQRAELSAQLLRKEFELLDDQIDDWEQLSQRKENMAKEYGADLPGDTSLQNLIPAQKTTRPADIKMLEDVFGKQDDKQ